MKLFDLMAMTPSRADRLPSPPASCRVHRQRDRQWSHTFVWGVANNSIFPVARNIFKINFQRAQSFTPYLDRLVATDPKPSSSASHAKLRCHVYLDLWQSSIKKLINCVIRQTFHPHVLWQTHGCRCPQPRQHQITGPQGRCQSHARSLDPLCNTGFHRKVWKYSDKVGTTL